MAKNDAKILKDELRPLKDFLEIVKDKVGRMETFQGVTMQNIRDIKEQQSVMNQKLDELEEELDEVGKDLNEVKDTQETRVLPPVAYIETTIKGYADSYVTNEDHIGRLNKRVTTVEDKLGIQPPEELTIPIFE